MATAKEQIKQILDSQPDDSSYEEIFKELAFKCMIENGLSDLNKNKVISNTDMEKRIQEWQK